MTLIVRRQVAVEQSVELREERRAGIASRWRPLRSEWAHAALIEDSRGERSARSAGRIGTFAVEVATGVTKVSPKFRQIYGMPVVARYHARDFEAQILPGDRPLISRIVQARRHGAARHRISDRRPHDGDVRRIA